jgi:hypothetical protein
LGSIFREFEQVESMEPRAGAAGGGVGLGLAVVARIVEQYVDHTFVVQMHLLILTRLGGQLRVESKVGEGSRFSFLIPLALSVDGDELRMASPEPTSKNSSLKSLIRSRKASMDSAKSAGEIDSLVEALGSNYMMMGSPQERYLRRTRSSSPVDLAPTTSTPGTFGVPDSSMPVRPVKVDGFAVDLDPPASMPPTPYEGHYAFPSILESSLAAGDNPPPSPSSSSPVLPQAQAQDDPSKLRVLIVEVTDSLSQSGPL